MMIRLTWGGTPIAVAIKHIIFLEEEHNNCIVNLTENNSLTVEESYDTVLAMLEVASMPKIEKAPSVEI